ncbi:hypothetical protein BV898_02033 [Hypsibius exemplaris]|uniref:NADH dehydrogenase [ubiquinone] 1 alpha subcomplex subunit 7 n=1 Tax=Hypsibius exemplaris TaxID=2072580 RepID=A0A1W0X9J7_HYPEX|nr:hypothetical protein BV898_02033 [Hypsibius exemplaris]
MSLARKALLAATPKRNISWPLQKLRAWLVGRPALNNNNRFAQEQSPRDQPLPNLPLGPNHKLAANYYCSHDGRREMQPPTLLHDHQDHGTLLLPKNASVTSAKGETAFPIPRSSRNQEVV